MWRTGWIFGDLRAATAVCTETADERIRRLLRWVTINYRISTVDIRHEHVLGGPGRPKRERERRVTVAAEEERNGDTQVPWQ